MNVPKKISERIRVGLKEFSPILQSMKDRDVSEADTVTVVKDILASVFGFDKYTEVTGEHAIRGTFCDLAIKLGGKLELLIEVKAIGSDLNDRYVKQAIDYAANQGVDWVVLTNGVGWVLYHVLFKKPIDKEEVARVNLLEINPRQEAEMDRMYLFCKEGIEKDARTQYRDRKDATSHHMLAAIILNSDAIISALRREVRAMSDIVVDRGAIEKVLREQVIKREALEGDQALEAQRRFARKVAKAKRQATKAEAAESDDAPEESAEPLTDQDASTDTGAETPPESDAAGE